jgi:hypothetical protein
VNTYKELDLALDKVLSSVHEDDQFKRRLRKLIANALEGDYLEDDVKSIMELVNLEDNKLLEVL